MLDCAVPRLKKLDATRVHRELEVVLGPDAMPYSAVTHTLRSEIWTQIDPKISHSEIDNSYCPGTLRAPVCFSEGTCAKAVLCANYYISSVY
jgi:hypothetical protein